MSRFIVTLDVTEKYEIELEASDESLAKDIAQEVWSSSSSDHYEPDHSAFGQPLMLELKRVKINSVRATIV